MQNQHKADILLEHDETISIEEVEGLLIQNIEIDNIFNDARIPKELREKISIQTSLHTIGTNYDFSLSKRPTTEVFGAYKIARIKGARINSIKMWNMDYSFWNEKVKKDSTAFMYHNVVANDYWIVLLPDNTNNRITKETIFYTDKMIISSISPNMEGIDKAFVKNNLLFLQQNLNLLNTNERCAQTLIHEYGHVLLWKLFNKFGLHNDVDIFDWFIDNGYAQNVSSRVPCFNEVAFKAKQLWAIKESFVEDFRISLNMQLGSDMFILPNVICFLGDFWNNNPLFEGIDIVKRLISDVTEESSNHPLIVENEPDRISISEEIYSLSMKSSVRPGTPSMREIDFKIIKRELSLIRTVKNEAAASLEKEE